MKESRCKCCAQHPHPKSVCGFQWRMGCTGSQRVQAEMWRGRRVCCAQRTHTHTHSTCGNGKCVHHTCECTWHVCQQDYECWTRSQKWKLINDTQATQDHHIMTLMSNDSAGLKKTTTQRYSQRLFQRRTTPKTIQYSRNFVTRIGIPTAV